MLDLLFQAYVCLVVFCRTNVMFFFITVASKVLLLVLRPLPPSWIPKRIQIHRLQKTASLNVNWKSYVVMFKMLHAKQNCKLKVGMDCPNPELLTLDKRTVKLLDVAKAGRLLVVNFGSCT